MSTPHRCGTSECAECAESRAHGDAIRDSRARELRCDTVTEDPIPRLACRYEPVTPEALQRAFDGHTGYMRGRYGFDTFHEYLDSLEGKKKKEETTMTPDLSKMSDKELQGLKAAIDAELGKRDGGAGPIDPATAQKFDGRDEGGDGPEEQARKAMIERRRNAWKNPAPAGRG